MQARQFVVDFALVVSAIGTDLFHRGIYLFNEFWEHVRIVDIRTAHPGRYNFSAVRIYAYMYLVPDSPFALAMLAYFPFAFTVDLQPHQVDYPMQRFVLLTT
jgi:hypothetical protein